MAAARAALQRGIDTLQHALELNPSNAQAHVAMGAALALSAARQCRSELSLDEVMLTPGRRIRSRLALLWDRAG